MKAPVLSREVFYTKQRDGSFRLLDFCLVNTSIGGLVESRPIALFGVNKLVDNDVYDLENFNSIREMDENQFYALTGTGGLQGCR
jgi:hypothetical protein